MFTVARKFCIYHTAWGVPVALVLCLGQPAVFAAPKKIQHSRPTAATTTQAHSGDMLILGEAPTAPPRAAAKNQRVGSGRQPAARPITPQVAAKPFWDSLNGRLVRFCRANLGRKVGNGQCTELVVLGLPTIGAQPGVDYNWGDFVCEFRAGGGRQTISVGQAGRFAGTRTRANVLPGDIIQYEGVTFERHWNGGYSIQSAPHHTSVISQVSADGRAYKVLEQNVNNTQYVRENVIYLDDMTTGSLRITRPIPRYQ